MLLCEVVNTDKFL